MTRFQKDYETMKKGTDLSILKKRKAEIDRLTKEGRGCKNKFRQTCIAQDLIRLKKEYEALEALY